MTQMAGAGPGFLIAMNRCQNGRQLLELLDELGYVDAGDAILDAIREAGLESKVNLGKKCNGLMEISDEVVLDLGADDLSNVLCKLRARDGFTDAEMRELKEAFRMQMSGMCEEISSPAIQKALRWLGHSYAFEVVQHFVGELDVDFDGRLDFTLFVKLIRKCRDLERRAASAAFHRLDVAALGVLDDAKQCQAFASLGCLDSRGNPPPRSLSECSAADLPTFLNIVQRYKFSTSRLHELRLNAGYSEPELAALRTHFLRFDKDGNGVLRRSELVQLIEVLFPRHASLPEFRPYFMQLLGYADADKSDSLDFTEFVRMIRKISDHEEEHKYESFNKTLSQLRFSAKEAAEFRGLFLQADQSGTCMLSFADVKAMIAGCCILDVEQSQKLLGFCRSAVENSNDLTSGLEQVNFLAFLHIMRDVIDAGWVHTII
ncbi:cbpM [Symbiodinium natans]|uniref:CbpM protein n=1 Tax=Symbiodinium natans TaxID=878477 RepID=A0A812V4E6_9DINO|nr:cbpM [Symbiodinium natans]